MGLFSDYASTLGLNGGATYFNEAELREEMENLEAMPDYEFDENSDIEECCIQSLLINEQNFNKVMMSVAHEEMQQYIRTGSDVVTEGAIGDLIDKLKSLVDKAWEKIKSIYNKCLATLNSWISTDKRFVEKYSDTIRSADKKCFEFFGYEVKNNVSNLVTSAFKNINNSVSNAFKKLTTGKGASNENQDYSKSNASDWLKNDIYGNGRGQEQYIHDLKGDLGIDKKVKITSLKPDDVIKELKEGKQNKKDIKESYKAAKSSIAAMKKDIDYLKKYTKAPDEKATSKPNFSIASTICSKSLTLLQQIQRVGIKAQNVYHHNCRKAAARAVRGVTDSTNESFEDFNLDVNTSSNSEFGFLV